MIKKKHFQSLAKSLLASSILVSVPLVSMPAFSQSNVEKMRDLSPSHWAYKAIKQLVDKYGVLSGFPDKTFRGQRAFNRYEASAALYKLMLKVEEMLLSQPKVQQVQIPTEDILLLKDLNDEFRRELDAMKASNSGQFAKLKNLEEDMESLKGKFGKIKFSGVFSTGFDDTFEDTIRPDFSNMYRLNMKVTVNDNMSLNARFQGNFSSGIKEEEDKGKTTKKEKNESSLGFKYAWADYNLKDQPLKPQVRVGYMWMGVLVGAGTSITSYFPGSTRIADPDLNSGGKKRGIRLSSNVTGGVKGSSGPFSFAFAANPNIFAGNVGLDFGLVKLKLVGDVDQTLLGIGEQGQDPMHNEALILDIGNDNFGFSAQANFRGLPDNWDFRAASGLVYTNVLGLEVGGTAKFENEQSQQIIAGAFVKTPNKIGNFKVPSLLVSLQEPLTLENGQILEGSKLSDKAGLYAELNYDNPVLPNLTIYFDQKTNILFSYGADLISTTYGVSTDFGF